LVTSGCAVNRDGYDVPKLSLPAQYKHSLSSNSEASSVSDSTTIKNQNSFQEENLTEWWRIFGSSELVGLIDRGLANNADIRIATLKMAQAKGRANQARADTMPTISAPVGTAIQAPGGAIGSVPVGSNGLTLQHSYQASLRGVWRADIWGEQRSLAESANFQLWQAAFDRDNVQRNVVANIAISYIEFLALNDRLRVARRNEVVLSGLLNAVEARLDVEDATVLELDQQKVTVFGEQSIVHGLEQQRENALANIAFLVGTVPELLKLSDNGLDALALPVDVPAMPSSLLFHRPDVRAIEARLLAADADVDVARARLLPPLDLSTQIGYSSLAAAQLFQPASLFWNTIANVTANIFDGGKQANTKENAKALRQEMVETYARTIFQAVKEVDGALVAIRMTGKRLNAQQNVANSSHRAWDSSAEAYKIGSIDYMTLLESQRTHYRHQDEYRQLKMSLYDAYINLFQALGGGVDSVDRIPGKGQRPVAAQADSSQSSTFQLTGSAGVDWNAKVADQQKTSSDPYWQVELPGIYYRSTIEATARDLHARFAKLMENYLITPRLSGQIETGEDGQSAWYRLYVGKFSSPQAALDLCVALQAGSQRCRVVSSQSDETVELPVSTKIYQGEAKDPSVTIAIKPVLNIAPQNLPVTTDPMDKSATSGKPNPDKG
jgi:NodT family efflux transporter outer membrane factor (OMF) lipoprotein